MMRKATILLPLFCFIPVFTFAAVRINPEKLYKTGVEAFEACEYEKAMKLFQDAIGASLSDKELRGAYVRMLKASLMLDRGQDILIYERKCKNMIPNFEVHYSDEDGKLLRLIPSCNIEYADMMNDKDNVRTHYKAKKYKVFRIANGRFADLTDDGSLKVKVSKVELYTKHRPSICKTILIIKRNGKQKKIKALTCDGVNFPGIFDNYAISLLTFSTDFFELEIIQVRPDNSIEYVVNKKPQQPRYGGILKIDCSTGESESKSLEFEIGTLLPLPGSKARFKVAAFRRNFMRMGPAVLIVVETERNENTSFWVFLNRDHIEKQYPGILSSKFPKLNPSRFKPYTFFLQKVYVLGGANIIFR